MAGTNLYRDSRQRLDLGPLSSGTQGMPQISLCLQQQPDLGVQPSHRLEQECGIGAQRRDVVLMVLKQGRLFPASARYSASGYRCWSGRRCRVCFSA